MFNKLNIHFINFHNIVLSHFVCYPLEENNPVYCSGPELYVALKMGAEITIVSGVVANVLKDNIGKTVYPYRYIVSELVAARSEAANAHIKARIKL